MRAEIAPACRFCKRRMQKAQLMKVPDFVGRKSAFLVKLFGIL